MKYGFPVPPAKMTQRFFSRWRIARRRMNGSATARTSKAVMTRVWIVRFSIASWSASPLMTVASIPMLSPVTRSIPCVAAETPRMMLPPPITIAISTPRRATSATSSAMRATTAGSMPNAWPPRRASPDSFSRIRR